MTHFLLNYSEPHIPGYPIPQCDIKEAKPVVCRLFRKRALLHRKDDGRSYISMRPVASAEALDLVDTFTEGLNGLEPPFVIPDPVQQALAYDDVLKARENPPHHHENSMVHCWAARNEGLANAALSTSLFRQSHHTYSPYMRCFQHVTLRKQRRTGHTDQRPDSNSQNGAELDVCIARYTRRKRKTDRSIFCSAEFKASCSVPDSAYELLRKLHNEGTFVKAYLENGKWVSFEYELPAHGGPREKRWIDMILSRLLQCAAYASEMRTSFTPLFCGGPFALAGVVSPPHNLPNHVGFTLPMGKLANGEVLNLPGWPHDNHFPSLVLVMLSLAYDRMLRASTNGDNIGTDPGDATDSCVEDDPSGEEGASHGSDSVEVSEDDEEDPETGQEEGAESDQEREHGKHSHPPQGMATSSSPLSTVSGYTSAADAYGVKSSEKSMTSSPNSSGSQSALDGSGSMLHHRRPHHRRFQLSPDDSGSAPHDRVVHTSSLSTNDPQEPGAQLVQEKLPSWSSDLTELSIEYAPQPSSGTTAIGRSLSNDRR